MYFGISTQSDNALGSVPFYTLDGSGTLVTVYDGAAQSLSFIDSGSNAYFFNSSSIPVCTDATAFYCPVSGGAATSLAESATVQGINGQQSTVDFSVDNADSLFATSDSAFPNLAGPNASANGPATGFDWGLPFFYGRGVYVLFENQTLNGTTGPAVAF